jgi:peroxiredoxin
VDASHQDQERAGLGSHKITGPLVLILAVILLAGALLVRLAGDDVPSLPTEAATEAARAESYKGPAREGRPAPDFTLLDLDGRPVSLSDWRGRPVLINFWATWCGPCEVEMSDIQAAYEAHAEQDFVVLAVAVDDNAQNVRRFFEKHNLTFQPLLDDGQVSGAYQVFGLPTSFFVNADGHIIAVHTGVLTKSKIEEYLARTRTE